VFEQLLLETGLRMIVLDPNSDVAGLSDELETGPNGTAAAVTSIG